LNFVYGSYYVKINSFNTGAEDREVLQAIAKKMAENLGEKGDLLSLLSAFPPEGKKVNSEKYITRHFLGYTFFNSAYTADDKLAGKTFKLFLIEAADKNECKSIIQNYFRQIKNPERGVTKGGRRYRILTMGLLIFSGRGRIYGTPLIWRMSICDRRSLNHLKET
jgi:hypothetical protein